jgi:hypothetical protein
MTRSMDRRSLDWLISLLFLTLLTVPLEARPKKDVIRFKNGDHWTCEIKKLDHGYLYVGLDYVDGDVSIDWREVASLESPQQFVVIDLNGTILVGPFATSTGPKGQRNLPYYRECNGSKIARIVHSADRSALLARHARWT